MRIRTAVIGLFAVLGILVLSGVALAAVRSGEALPGTTVAGVDVGGLGRADIRDRLSAVVEESTTGNLELVHDDLEFTVNRADMGVDVDLEETVDRALESGRDGVLGPLLGRGKAVDLVTDVEGDGLDGFVRSVADVVNRDPFPGGFEVNGTEVTAQPPQPGRTLDVEQAETDVEQALAVGRTTPVQLPVEEQDPGTTAADVDEIVAQARDALTAPIRLTAPEGELALAPAEIGDLLSVELVNPVPVGQGALAEDLRLGVDREQLTELVQRKAAGIDVAPVQATFTTSPTPPTVDTKGDLTWTPQPAQVTAQPGQPGHAVQVEPAVERIVELLRSPQREAPLPIEVVHPDFNPAQADITQLNQLLGTFTTYFQPGQPRVTNIRRIAEVVDGTYVPPGGTFSLNEAAGRRTTAKGYVADGAIINGELVDQVGGGVSQFATTLFNAAFFAGLPILEHKPHSFYISRYPAGRESTVSYPVIDVVIKNDTDHGMVIQTASTPRSVTVSIYGNNGGRQVSAIHGPRKPRSGGGFTINVTRTISGGDGRGERRVFHTVYNPPPD